jgi:hypothetical protein
MTHNTQAARWWLQHSLHEGQRRAAGCGHELRDLGAGVCCEQDTVKMRVEVQGLRGECLHGCEVQAL